MHSVPELAEPQTGTEVGAEATTWADIAILPTIADARSRASVASLWRRTARLRGKLGSSDDDGSGAEHALSLEVVLLRERVARLTSDIHRPVDTGAVIDRTRRLASGLLDAEDEDDAWSVLSECLCAQEALAQATLEIEAAIAAAAQRLRGAGELTAAASDQAWGTIALAGTRVRGLAAGGGSGQRSMSAR